MQSCHLKIKLSVFHVAQREVLVVLKGLWPGNPEFSEDVTPELTRHSHSERVGENGKPLELQLLLLQHSNCEKCEGFGEVKSRTPS